MQSRIVALHGNYAAESEGNNYVYLYLLGNGEKEKFRSVPVSPKEPTVKGVAVLVKGLLWGTNGKYLAISVHEGTEERVAVWDMEYNQFVELSQTKDITNLLKACKKEEPSKLFRISDRAENPRKKFEKLD